MAAAEIGCRVNAFTLMVVERDVRPLPGAMTQMEDPGTWFLVVAMDIPALPRGSRSFPGSRKGLYQLTPV